MAISKNLWLQGASQRLAGAVLYQVAGETRIRELAASVSNPRTQAQMVQRVKMANLIAFYRANKAWMMRAFENKPRNNSDYNRFVSLNLTNNSIYLTKQEANAGACVVAPYRVTEGTLPSVEFTPFVDGWFTNIYLGSLDEITETTTVGQFATAVLSANAGLQEGDQLSFIRLTQMTNSASGYPYIIVRKYEVILRSTSAELLSAYMPIDYLQPQSLDEYYVLAIMDSGLAGGFVMAVSRTMGSKILVSTQDVVVANNAEQINAHSGPQAMDAAIASYGEGQEIFLSSSSAEGLPTAYVPIAIVSYKLAGVQYVPGDVIPASVTAGDTLEITFSTNIPANAEPTLCNVYKQGGITNPAQFRGAAHGVTNVVTLTASADHDFDTGASVVMGEMQYVDEITQVVAAIRIENDVLE